MFKNYLLITLRTLLRNKIFSAINISGLAIGMTACFLIYQYVRFEESYDRFHSNTDRIYRASVRYVRGTTTEGGAATTGAALAPAMKAEFPEVEEYARLVKTSLLTSDLTSYVTNALEFSRTNEQHRLVSFIEEKVYFSDAPTLTMFSFPLLAGDARTALKEPNSIVLTESAARKYFGDDPALGREIHLNRQMNLTVTGVLKDLPENSHLQFDILISFSTMAKKNNIGDGSQIWGWYVFYNYIMLRPNADPNAVEAQLPTLRTKYLGKQADELKEQFYLQPIKDIHLHSDLDAEFTANGSYITIYFLSLLAVFILVVAWVNFINLSTAKALERAREVGLRKVVGASRRQLIGQFLTDAFVINSVALCAAAILTIACWPYFEHLVGKELSRVLFASGIHVLNQWILPLLAFLIAVLLVGIYPALVLSSFQPVIVLKGNALKSKSGTVLRKLMISFQYVLAVLLIAGTMTIRGQLSFMQAQDPGYAKGQIVVLEAPAVYDSTANSRISSFKNSVLQINAVNNVTTSYNIPGQWVTEGSGMWKPETNDPAFGSAINSVDTNFFKTYGIPLLAGRTFSQHERMGFRVFGRNEKAEPIPVIVNEEYVRRMHLKESKDALHQKMNFGWGPEDRTAEIIGVVADHHQESLKVGFSAIMYVLPQWTAAKYFSVNLSMKNLDATLKSLEASYRQAFPENSFTYFFLDEYVERQYRADAQFEQIFTVFTGLAIVITCMGLIGLSIYSVNQRIREIGVRKVLGASVSSILALFGKDFVKQLLISWLIASPLVYVGAQHWLETFPFRIPIAWTLFVGPLAVLLIVTICTILLITLKAAIESPVRALRQE